MTEFIFMLTHHDVTVPNALEILDEIKKTGLRFIGCKDIGLPIQELKHLFAEMRTVGMTTFLEVVSNDEEKHFEGVAKALSVDADYLIGSMPRFVKKTLDYLRERKSSLKFFPYIGKVVGHPCRLEGSVDEIVGNGMEFEKMGVHGINLLLYRYGGDTNLLLETMVKSLEIPLIVAGSIDNFDKIDQMKQKEVWAFTIGGAIMEKKFIEGKSLGDQVAGVLDYL